ncbi:MAG: MBL fold metallo-hydrolase [Chloroflexota bacterium]
MKVKWLGHASFLITGSDGTRIITDPYATDHRIKYGDIHEAAEIVTVSHGHFDHGNVAAVKGNPAVVKESGEAKGIRFRGIPTFHDDEQGSKRGPNMVFCFELDGVKVCHLGDLGHPLGDDQAKAIGAVDVLLIPVGGTYTIDAAAATGVCQQLKSRIVIPMHYKTDRCPDFPVTGVDVFLKGKSGVKEMPGSDVEITRDNLPAEMQIIVLQPAL